MRYKGRDLILSPESGPAANLAEVTKLDFIAAGHSALINDEADKKMKAEMQAEWEKDWSQI